MTRPETDTVKTSRKSRKAVPLNESLERRMLAYALAGGPGIFAIAQPAEANSIVFTNAHDTSIPSGGFQIDLNHDGVNDFNLFRSKFAGASVSSVMDAIGDAGNAVMATSLGQKALALTYGAAIGPSQDFSPNGNMAAAFTASALTRP
jgi:hypothetical protein